MRHRRGSGSQYLLGLFGLGALFLVLFAPFQLLSAFFLRLVCYSSTESPYYQRDSHDGCRISLG